MINRKQKGSTYFLVIFTIAFVLIGFSACRREHRLTAAEWRQTQQAAQAKFRACIPATQPEGNVRLALAEARNEANQFRVKLIAYALQETADFDVPQYWMSRGRWLINERWRSFVRDEQCNNYELKERAPTISQVPDSGRIQIKAGEFYELTLIYPSLSEEVRQGVLVYGNWVIPFALP